MAPLVPIASFINLYETVFIASWIYLYEILQTRATFFDEFIVGSVSIILGLVSIKVSWEDRIVAMIVSRKNLMIANPLIYDCRSLQLAHGFGGSLIASFEKLM